MTVTETTPQLPLRDDKAIASGHALWKPNTGLENEYEPTFDIGEQMKICASYGKRFEVGDLKWTWVKQRDADGRPGVTMYGRP